MPKGLCKSCKQPRSLGNDWLCDRCYLDSKYFGEEAMEVDNTEDTGYDE